MKLFLLLFVSLFYLLLTTAKPISAQGLSVPWASQDTRCVYNTSGGQVATIQGVECLLRNVSGVAITLIGFAILAMLVFGAFRILTSAGDPKAVEAGKNIITYAVLGLVVALSSYFIIQLIANFTGAENIDTFNTQVN